MTEQTTESLLPPSKRAARRIVQRAFVLTGRDRHLRQHIREVRLTTLWILEDWDLVWTVIIDRGRLEFERRPVKHPDLVFNWGTASEFFASASDDRRGAALVAGLGQPLRPPLHSDTQSALTLSGNVELRRIASNLLHCFLGHLGHVLRNPVDGVGESLL
ncbi:MAG: hypothetical protein ABSF46_06325 [Terriglobia bacterium]|jgi:hypothetical protein